MKLITEIPLEPQKDNQIDYHSKILLLGSCFAENIGQKFSYFKFQSTVNPLGILFHPLAINSLISRSITKNYYTEKDLVFYNEVWSCFEAHSKFNRASKEDLIMALNAQLDNTNKKLKNATHVILTLGTSWVYRHLEQNKVVANCHKFPQKQFTKELLSIESITDSLKTTIADIKALNPEISIIFTVSPVRHIKDGFVENSLSKSHLLAAVHQLLEKNQHIYYFPSFELMLDELRDYRFYNSDMLHPNDLAVSYIWEKFKQVWFTTEAKKDLGEVLSIQTRKAHKPFNEASKAHQKFLNTLKEDIKILQTKYPDMVF